jgi:hypothetical protein
MGKLVDFAIWLALAMLGGVLIVVVWEWLRAKYSARVVPPESAPPGDA